MYGVPGWAGPWLLIASLAVWTGSGSVWALLPASAGFVLAAIDGARDRRAAGGFGLVVLLSGILVAFFAERQVASILQDWEGYWAQRVDQVEDLLTDELDRRRVQGEANCRQHI